MSNHPLSHKLIAAFFAVAAMLAPVAVVAETRVALIIANSKYTAFDQLSNPSADAHLVAAALEKTGFKVTVLEDLNLTAMNKALQQFGNQADGADVALVYYAGHGVEVDHVNYIVPVDVTFAHDRDVDIEAVKLDRMLSVTENAKRLRIVILDACRANPFFDKLKKTMAQAGPVSKGMTAVEPSKNSLVIYSAKAGTVASDGRVNSPFAEALAKRIVEPGREISLLLRQVRDDVLDRTKGFQEPFTYGSLSSQEFYFIPPVAVAAAPLVPAIDIEAETWTLCKTSLSRAPCDNYLKTYPVGRYAVLVQTRVTDITHSASAAAAAANLAANVAAARAASVAATNAANLAATYAATLAASSPDAIASLEAASGNTGIAARSTSLGAAATPLAPPSIPTVVAPLASAAAPTNVASATIAPAPAAIVATGTPLPAPVTVAPRPTVVQVAAPTPAPIPAPVVVAAAAPRPAPVFVAPAPAPVVASAPVPAPKPVQIAMLSPTPVPTPAPIERLTPAPVPAPAPTVVAMAAPRPTVAAAPVVPTSARIGDLGITVRYDKVAKGIFVDSIDHNAPLVAGRLFLGDLIMKIGTAVPDAAQAPDTQIAANWKSDGRLKLLVKRGDAVSVVMIVSN